MPRAYRTRYSYYRRKQRTPTTSSSENIIINRKQRHFGHDETNNSVYESVLFVCQIVAHSLEMIRQPDCPTHSRPIIYREQQAVKGGKWVVSSHTYHCNDHIIICANIIRIYPPLHILYWRTEVALIARIQELTKHVYTYTNWRTS